MRGIRKDYNIDGEKHRKEVWRINKKSLKGAEYVLDYKVNITTTFKPNLHPFRIEHFYHKVRNTRQYHRKQYEIQ